MTAGAARVSELEPSTLQVEDSIEWLCSRSVLAPHGAVLSWANPDGNGFEYPEAAGLWLALLAGDSERRAQTESVAEWLCSQVDDEGGIGRDGARYLFDTAMVLNGLVSHARATGSVATASAMERAHRFIMRCIVHSAAVAPEPGADRRWSLGYGPHQMKVAIALVRYADLRGAPLDVSSLDGLIANTWRHFNGRRFVTLENEDDSYLHGCIYALEGLLFLDHLGVISCRDALLASGDWLAEIQAPCGGVRAWSDGRRTWGPVRADATAQAVRLWVAVDRFRWSEPIRRAVDALGGLHEPGGGFRYASDSLDVNTWATLFAVQALRWVNGDTDPYGIV